ncbi:MAG: radical SAM protein [Elusimicrobia bacterium]|nr:radical SAM protein [Elusimicrobiota bacterium]
MDLSAPLFVSWQLTRDCNLACLHCCTDSAPGRKAPGELSREEALRVARQIVEAGVPYAMVCGGEPTIVPWFWEVVEVLGRGGVQLKIETNGQSFGPSEAARLASLPIRSVQISLDGDSEAVYAKQRPGGVLSKAHAACRAVVSAGLPLEITFAPTRVNIHEAEAVAARAVSLGAFRFNTGALMRLGTAAKLWDRLEPTVEQYAAFRAVLERLDGGLNKKIEYCYTPFTIEEGLREGLSAPPATLLVLPDGRVKVAAPLPFTCADLRQASLAQAWDDYRSAWERPQVREAADRLLAEPERLADANTWRVLDTDLRSTGDRTTRNAVYQETQ